MNARIEIPGDQIAEFCQRNHIQRLATVWIGAERRFHT